MLKQQVQYSVTLATENCCSCGVPFAVPEWFMAQRRKDKALFYCPNGHGQQYSQSEADRLRKMLEDANRQNTKLVQENREAWSSANAQQEGWQKAVKEMKRLKKRVAAGVCPCCNRTFQNLASHMKTKHKNFASDQTSKG